MTTLAVLLAAVYGAGEVARCESSRAWSDASVVLQTAANRANVSGRGLHAELRAPRQYSDHCPSSPRTWHPRHLLLGLRALTGTLDVPGWARGAVGFAGDYDPDDQCERWNMIEVGRIAGGHRYCGPAPVAARGAL